MLVRLLPPIRRQTRLSRGERVWYLETGSAFELYKRRTREDSRFRERPSLNWSSPPSGQ